MKKGKTGNYIRQKSGSTIRTYGQLIQKQSNGHYKALAVSTRGSTLIDNKAKIRSTKGWYPDPEIIPRDQVPAEVLAKIDKRIDNDFNKMARIV